MKVYRKYSKEEIESILQNDYRDNFINTLIISDNDNKAYETGLAGHLFENYEYANLMNAAKFYIDKPLNKA